VWCGEADRCTCTPEDLAEYMCGCNSVGAYDNETAAVEIVEVSMCWRCGERWGAAQHWCNILGGYA